MVVGDMIRMTASRDPAKIGIVSDEVQLSWRQFNERINALANAMLSLGMQKGERVAILGRHSHRYLEWYLAVAKAGLVGVPLNTWLKGGELSYLLRDSGASVLFLDPDYTALAGTLDLAGIRMQIGMAPGHGCSLDYESLLAGASTEEPSVSVDEEDLFVLSYTSGTTGQPKAAMISHRNSCAATLSHIMGMSMRPHHVFVMHAPLFFLAASNNRFNAIYSGCRTIVTTFEAAKIIRLIESDGVTHLTLSPTALQRMLEAPELDQHSLRSLEMVAGSGAPFSVSLVQRAIRRLGPIWHVIYGASESCIGTWLLKESWQAEGVESKLLASVGRAAPNCEVAVLDSKGHAVPGDSSSVGEIAIRGDSVTRGYWQDPEATACAIRNGWFYTGDLATCDEEGFIYIAGRSKEIIISGGINIFPGEVEGVIAEHPGVAQCAVIGVPDAEWGETPMAFVVLKQGMQASPDDIIAHCRSRLASYKKPRFVEFMAALPLTASGKVLKSALRDQAGAMQEAGSKYSASPPPSSS